MASAVRALMVLVLTACLSLAAAQTCQPELQAVAGDDLDRPATGLDAAVLMHAAVSLVEPALPRMMQPNVTVSEDQANRDTALQVAGWGLLPNSWTPEELSLEAWRYMNRRFLGWYGQSEPLPASVGTVGDLVADLARTLDKVSRSVRPAALLATDQDDGSRLSFMAIIWNWTAYPRLLVYRPERGLDLEGPPRDVLPYLSNCAVNVTAYILAPEETARDLFLAHNDSRMFVVATDPVTGGLPVEVPAGEELEAFAFGMPELSDARMYAAVFDGPEVGFATLLGLLSRVKTNVSPLSITSYLEIPAGR